MDENNVAIGKNYNPLASVSVLGYNVVFYIQNIYWPALLKKSLVIAVYNICLWSGG